MPPGDHHKGHLGWPLLRLPGKMPASCEGLINLLPPLLCNGLEGSRCVYILAQLSGKRGQGPHWMCLQCCVDAVRSVCVEVPVYLSYYKEWHVCGSHPHRRVSCWVTCVCVLLISVCVSVCCNVFMILAYSLQSTLHLSLSSPCVGVYYTHMPKRRVQLGFPEQASPTAVARFLS